MMPQLPTKHGSGRRVPIDGPNSDAEPLTRVV